MLNLNSCELLMYSGIVIMALSCAGAVLAFIILHTSGKSLRKKLEEEFGEKPD